MLDDANETSLPTFHIYVKTIIVKNPRSKIITIKNYFCFSFPTLKIIDNYKTSFVAQKIFQTYILQTW